ncbi:MAG TPA: hypothetical protein VK509_19010, partial [Polyangiales bacterium]|nr:hypothetical protein [Polyangiales bacterium]
MKHGAWYITVASALLLSAACGDHHGASSQSQTHWLQTCDADAECGSELACECGRCVAPCGANDRCDVAGLELECQARNSDAVQALCGAAEAKPLCLEPCDGSCASGQRCVAGACIAAGSTGSAGASGGDGGRAGQSGAGGSSGASGTGGTVPEGDGGTVSGGKIDPSTVPITCGADSPHFAAFDRECTLPSDCVIATYTGNCCAARFMG